MHDQAPRAWTAAQIPVLSTRADGRESCGSRAERRVGAPLGLVPSLSVMSYMDVAHADRRPVQRTGLGVAVGRGCSSMLRANGRADAGRIPLDLARPMRTSAAVASRADSHVSRSSV